MGDRAILSLDRGLGYTSVCICQKISKIHIKFVFCCILLL